MAEEDDIGRRRLKVVDEGPGAEDEVLRLGGGTVDRAQVREPGPDMERLLRGPESAGERRSIEPDIDAILDTQVLEFDPEERWTNPEAEKAVPYGWFVLIFLMIVGLLAWTFLVLLRPAEVAVRELRQEAVVRFENDERKDREAEQLVESIEATLAGYLAATGVEDLLPLVREPERVEPLMRAWYRKLPLEVKHYGGLRVFHPLTLEGRTFWLISAEVGDGVENFLLEQTDADEVRIDWETQVCYQPVSWDRYAVERPAGSKLDFRVYIERDWDGLFSHEFADEAKWDSYRLTTKNADEFLFGYVEKESAAGERLRALVEANQNQKSSVMLRLSLPAGTESPRGVVIEEVLSERWALITPPGGG